MASLEELRSVRLEKLEHLRSLGINPFPRNLTRDTSNQEVLDNWKEGQPLNLAGRITAIRGSGAINFVVFDDGTAPLQAVLKRDDTGEETMKLFIDTVDIGDFVWFSGATFTTDRGAKSLLVRAWKMAGKSLLPLPDKHAGLQDQDELYRKRYLDLLANEGSKDRFILRSKVIAAIRDFFNERGFIEVETPILQSQAGGALAKTFNTHHNDLDIDMVLRISLEIELKLLMAGGFPRIYEIGKNFRNEGSDPTHIQEFTMMEWYAAYATLEDSLAWTQELLVWLAKEVVGKTTFLVWDKEGAEHQVNFEGSWPVVRFDELVQRHANIDIHTATREELESKAREYGIAHDELIKASRANLLDFIFKKSARAYLIQPTFVTNYPGELKPLAIQNEDGTAEVAQLIIAGAELTNQYAELVDPLVQRELLEAQSRAKQAGDEEAMEVDERFLTAMEHGMPPMTGFGMGIDRLVAIFTEQRNLRDVIVSPIMRPRN